MSKKFSTEDILAQVRPTPMFVSQLSADKKIEIIAGHFQGIMETLGLEERQLKRKSKTNCSYVCE